MKKVNVSRDPDNNFITMDGAKGKKWNSLLYATAKVEPCKGGRLLLDFRTKHTFDDHTHEAVKRSLRGRKRQIIGGS